MLWPSAHAKGYFFKYKHHKVLNALEKLDEQLFLWLNGLHAPWLDTPMYMISGKLFWLPLYAVILFLIIRKYKWQSIPVLLCLGTVIALADQLTSGIMKPMFERFRPSHSPGLEGLVHHVNNYKGGKFGFASSHAANTFGLAMYVWWVLKDHYGKIWGLFVWAAVVSYSRIYLGVHFPGDIIVGGAIGLLAGYAMGKAALPSVQKAFSKFSGK